MVLVKILSSPFAYGHLLWRFLSLLQFIESFCWAAGPNCYDAAKHVYQTDNSACNSTAVDSVCCGNGWACLENGLCRSTSASPDIDAGV